MPPTSLRPSQPPAACAAPGSSPAADNRPVEVFLRLAARGASVDLDGLLRLVSDGFCELVGAQRCSIFLRDGGDDPFSDRTPCEDANVRPRSGDRNPARRGSGAPSDHVVRQIVETRAPVVARRSAVAAQAGSTTVLGVPIVCDEVVIAMVFLDQVPDARGFTADVVAAAATFAQLWSASIRQAQRAEQLGHQAEATERGIRTLSRAAEAQRMLHEQVLHGADLPALLGFAAGLLHKPLVMYTQRWDVVTWADPVQAFASAPAILNKKAITSVPVARALESLGTDQHSVLLPPLPDRGITSRRLICRLEVGGNPAGYLEMLEVGSPISSTDVRIAEATAAAVSLTLWSEQREARAGRLAQEDLFHDLLIGNREPAALLRRTASLGIDLSLPHVVIRAHRRKRTPSADDTAHRSEIARTLAERLGCPVPLAATMSGADLYLIGPLPGATASSLPALKQAIEHAVAQTAHLGITGVALSRLCHSIDNYPDAHRDLAVTSSFSNAVDGAPRILLHAELGLARYLVTEEQRRDALRCAQQLLGPLLADDDVQRLLLDTLRQFIAANASVRRSAELLNVHENTVRYRMSRISELTGIDVEQLDDLLEVRFALQVVELLAPRCAAPSDHQAA